jgi:diaminopimelate decarboxylase
MLYDHSTLLDEDAHDAEGNFRYKSAIFGQTCDGLDQISTGSLSLYPVVLTGLSGILLPEMRIGDWLVIPTMGAYTNGSKLCRVQLLTCST